MSPFRNWELSSESLDHLLGVAQEDQAEWGLELRLMLLSFPNGSRQLAPWAHWALLSGSQPTVHSSRLWEAGRWMARPLPASKNVMRSGWAGPKPVPSTTPSTTTLHPAAITKFRLEEASSGFLESLVFLEGRMRRINFTSQ